ncbi:protein disulfide oxidoreductase [Paraferrimonas haliotis]|uniref:Thioredoxin n=1 Tax=Paraferrimonas haliotis TaxID=2013866 RepID=A0AA37TL41_9GAMM|nr:protein disulfide oxidoreductase [Paraferrimonas haliotis]GLS83264.1 thioredoxin [Paraferrimonas haliotis]
MTKRKLVKYSKEAAIWFVVVVGVLWALDQYRGRDFPKQAIPQQVVMDTHGQKVDIMAASYETPQLVYFWGSWCPACRIVSPQVNKLASYYDVTSIAMASGSDEEINRYMAEQDYDFTVVNDDSSELTRAWGVSIAPTLFIIKNGEVSSFTIGVTSLPGLLLRLTLA